MDVSITQSDLPYRFATKEVQTPKAIFHVAEESQPGWTGGISVWFVLLFEKNGFRDYRAGTIWMPEPANGNNDMNQKDDKITHFNILSRTARA
jgi:hypothetical protein